MKLQGKLNKDVETCRKILKLFHPDLDITDEKLSTLLCNGPYNWVDIKGNIRGYGYVSVLITNDNDTSKMYGTGWKMSDFEERQSKLTFKAWRSSLDCLFQKTDNLSGWDQGLKEFVNSEPYILRPQYTKILTDAGYKTLSAQEWYDSYYTD